MHARAGGCHTGSWLCTVGGVILVAQWGLCLLGMAREASSLVASLFAVY
jgi:hypothetical protein